MPPSNGAQNDQQSKIYGIATNFVWRNVAKPSKMVSGLCFGDLLAYTCECVARLLPISKRSQAL